MVEALLIAGAHVDARDEQSQQSVLMIASRHGDIGLVRMLIEFGANVDLQDKWDEKAIHWAAQTGQS